jgi:hypothetical protein
MSHLDNTNLEISHLETNIKTKETVPVMQLKMLYIIARLLARILDKMGNTNANSN